MPAVFYVILVLSQCARALNPGDDLTNYLALTETLSWTEGAVMLMPESEFDVETIIVDNDTACGNYSFSYNGSANGSVSECSRTGTLEHAPVFDPSTLTRVIVLSIIAVLSLFGNLATLWSICKDKRQNSSTVYLLITHLALADLLVTLFCVFTEAMWTATVQWYAGDLMCKLIKYLQMFALYLSTFILVVIGFDRMCAVRYPMRRMHAKHQVRRGIAGVWFLSAVLSSPQLVIFRVKRGPFLEEFYQCVTYGFYTAAWQEQVYTSVSLILMFLLPLIILIVTYICTFCSIANSGKENMLSEKTVRSPLDDVRHKIIQKAKLKSLMITVVIVLAFVVCWTPYYVMMIIFIFLEPDEQLSDELQSAIFFFGSSTAMINPLIYGAFHLRRSKSRRSTTLKNSSSAMSSKVDNSVLMSTFRKTRSHSKPNQIEAGFLTAMPNGNFCNGTSKQLLVNHNNHSTHCEAKLSPNYLMKSL